MMLLSRRLPSSRTLQCFLAVAQELNFRSAAELLHMTQPPLTRQIQGLESLLGVQLIQRNTSRVTLTPAGEAFKTDAHNYLVALDSALGNLKARFVDQQESTDRVRIGLTSVVDSSLIPCLHALASDPKFICGNPLERAYSKHLVQRVLQCALDIAIVGNISGPLDGLAVEPVGSEAMTAVLPAGHPAVSKPVVTLSDFGELPLLWFSRNDNPAFYDKCESVFRAHSYTAPKRLEPKDFTSLLASVAAGEGVALCPKSMCGISRIGVTYRPLEPLLEKLLTIDIQMVSRAQETKTSVLDKMQAIRALSASWLLP
ncbi:LysR family transcriptional regulator [Pseudomonas sp. MOB-449]|nr:LysR family transcriptional regulator [Pseudomonas sp. MOB-449]